MTDSKAAKKTANAIRTRNNVITLGLIFSVSIVAVLPRSILVFYFYVGNKCAITCTLTMIFNNFFLLRNPVADLVIFVLRIKTYRQHLRLFVLYITNSKSVVRNGVSMILVCTYLVEKNDTVYTFTSLVPLGRFLCWYIDRPRGSYHENTLCFLLLKFAVTNVL